jgi:hypothetical protein
MQNEPRVWITAECVRDLVSGVMYRGKYDDEEAWHAREDDLVELVLRQIAEGHPDPGSVAGEAVKTYDLDFSRWCA